MKPPKELALLTAAIVAMNEIAAPHEENKAIAPEQPHDHKELLVQTPAVGSSALPITASNKQHLYAVEKVQDSPEVFWLLAIRHPEFKNGKFMQDFGGFTEADMRAALHQLGSSENESTYLIAKARMKWASS